MWKGEPNARAFEWFSFSFHLLYHSNTLEYTHLII